MGSVFDMGRAYSSSRAYMRSRYSWVSTLMQHITRRKGLRSFFWACAARFPGSHCPCKAPGEQRVRAPSSSSAGAQVVASNGPKPSLVLRRWCRTGEDAQSALHRTAPNPIPLANTPDGRATRRQQVLGGSPIPPYTPIPRSGDAAQVRRTVKNSNPGDISR